MLCVGVMLLLVIATASIAAGFISGILASIATGLIVHLARPVWELINLGRRYKLPDGQKLLNHTRRPIILYLRPFTEDYFTEGNYERRLVRALKRVGKVFAVADPAAELPPLGAARINISSDRWRDEVSELLTKAHAVVIYLGASNGLLWELEATLRIAGPEKAILCLPLQIGKGRQVDEGAYLSFWKPLMEQRFSKPFPRDPNGAKFMYFDADGNPEFLRLNWWDFVKRHDSSTPHSPTLQKLRRALRPPPPLWLQSILGFTFLVLILWLGARI